MAIKCRTSFSIGCSCALGVTDGSIKYHQLTASSGSVLFQPDHARFSSSGDAWCATVEDTNQYIQVNSQRQKYKYIYIYIYYYYLIQF